MYLGSTSPKEVNIHPAPKPTRTKSCMKRLKSGKEVVIHKEEKNKRQCAYCQNIDFHDKKTCPKRLKEERANSPKVFDSQVLNLF